MKKIGSFVGVCCISVSLLSGCSSMVSRFISDDGKGAQELNFPEITDAWRSHGEEGTFPDMEDLRKVVPGVTKEQLYTMFGPPHFSEGMFGVREWDYVFQLQRPNDKQPTLCQYKVLFDTEYKGQSFYWKPESCAALVNGKSAPVKAGTYTLKNEVLFPHDRSSISDIRSEGREAIQDLVAKIKGDYSSIDKITVVGHTDRLGSDSYNLALSKARAQTVRNLLINEGFSANKIIATGAGETNPISRNCVGEHFTPELSACLQEDRRVEVQVNGRRK